MSPRRLLLSVLLAFGLLLAQPAAFLHELGHIGGAGEVSAKGERSRSGDAAHAACERCLAFAQLANALTSHRPLPELAAQRVREATPCATGTAGQPAPAACSRDPPRFL